MIALGMSHQMLHEVLGHYVVRNVTKFQSCGRENNFFTGKKHRKDILIRTIPKQITALNF